MDTRVTASDREFVTRYPRLFKLPPLVLEYRPVPYPALLSLDDVTELWDVLPVSAAKRLRLCKIEPFVYSLHGTPMYRQSDIAAMAQPRRRVGDIGFIPFVGNASVAYEVRP